MSNFQQLMVAGETKQLLLKMKEKTGYSMASLVKLAVENLAAQALVFADLEVEEFNPLRSDLLAPTTHPTDGPA